MKTLSVPIIPLKLSFFFLVQGFFTACGDSGAGPGSDASPDDQLTSVEQHRDQAGPDLPPPPVIDIRADVNRDGVISLDDPSEDEGEETWNQKQGAVFLANIDDDEAKCPKNGSDIQLAQCNDAANEVIDGQADLLDLARLMVKPWPTAPAEARGYLQLSSPGDSYARLFKKDAQGQFALFDPQKMDFSSEELRKGVELAIEGKDIVRNKSAWDGFLDVTFIVKKNGSLLGEDKLRLRISPVMTFHHLLPVQTAYVVKAEKPSYMIPISLVFRQDFKKAVDAAKVPQGLVELDVPPEEYPGEEPIQDPWTQDFFETGYMSMPSAGGEQHVIQVFYRSANVDAPDDTQNPLRIAGRILFTALRGKDKAVVQEFNIKHDVMMDTLNSFGNTETIPPFSTNTESFPLGRLFRGNVTSFHPDENMTRLLEDQGMQPPIYVDTSWLLVGHVDETISFIKANSPRGWAMLVADPALARTMLENAVSLGYGNTKMFIGKKVDLYQNGKWYEIGAETTIQQVLDDTEIMSASAKAAVKIDAQLQILKKETGITEQEIVRVPALFETVYHGALAYLPDMVNGTYLSDSHFASPDPHGPIIGGKDIFKSKLEELLQPFGVIVDWVEDWDLLHRAEGEVHCGSNSFRQIPKVKWWETGR